MRIIPTVSAAIKISAAIAYVVFLQPEAWAVELETVISGLKHRESLLRNIDLKWEATNYYAPRYKAKLAATPFDDTSSGSESSSTAFHTTNITWHGRLVVEGDRLRYEHDIPLWSFPQSRFVQNSNVHVFDGTTETFLSGQSQTGVPLNGFIRDHDKFIRDDVSIAWLLAHAQPTHKSSYLAGFLTTGADFSELESEGERYVVAEFRQTRSGGTRRMTTVWFNPAKQWSIRRVFKMRDGSPTNDLQFTNTLHESGICIPTAWKGEEFDSQGRLLKSTSAKITSCEVNQTISDATFRLDFPKSTLVTDQRQDAPVPYSVALDNGSKLTLTEKDLLSGNDIATISASAQRRQTRKWSTSAIVAGLSAVGVLVALVALKLARRSSK